MSTDEYTPSEDDDRIAHAYAEVVHLKSEGMVSRDEAVGKFYAYLAAHDARVRRDAAREALDGLVIDLQDLHEVAMYSGIRANALLGANRAAIYRDTHYPETED